MGDSFKAGLLIGLGGITFLAVDDRVLGAFLFSIGLLGVIMFRANLYTGWVCKPSKYRNPFQILNVLGWNFLGAVFIAILTWCEPIWIDKATTICLAKLDTPWPIWCLNSVLCGAFIAIAVRGYEYSRSNLIIVLGVMGFILVGAEHVVADIFYFSVAKMMDLWSVIARLWVCAIGNMIGGLLIGLGKPEV